MRHFNILQTLETVSTFKPLSIIVVLFILSELSCLAEAQNPAPEQNDTTGVSLQELTISAPKVRRYFDHDILFMGEDNENFGTNALDAVSSLPAFIPSISASSLSNLKGESVTIFINGRKSTYDELKTYTGAEIKNVKYYPVAVGKYRAYASGAVADITIRKPQKRYYRVSLNNTNRFEISRDGFKFATEAAGINFAYMDSLNMVRVGYSGMYRNQGNIHRDITYDYGDFKNIYTTGNGHAKDESHSVYGSYQYSTPTDMVTILAEYGNSPHADLEMPMSTLTYDKGKPYEGNRLSQSLTSQSTGKLGVFYDKLFNSGASLGLSLEGSYTTGDKTDILDIDIPGLKTFNSNTDAHNHAWSAIFRGNYSQTLGKGDFTVSSDLHFNHLAQKYCGKDTPNLMDFNLSLMPEYSLMLGQKAYLSMWLGYMLMRNEMVGEDNNVTTHQPTGGLSLAYMPHPCWRFEVFPGIGYTTMRLGSRFDNKLYLDDNYYCTGNFDLKPEVKYWFNLEASYSTPDGKLNVGMSTNMSYIHNTFNEYIIKDGDQYYNTTLNTPNQWEVTVSAYGKYSPLNWLSVNLFSMYIYTRYPGGPCSEKEMYNVSQVMTTAGLSINYGHWQFTGNLRLPYTGRGGDRITKNHLKIDCEALYRVKSFWVSLGWYYNSNTMDTTYEIPGFKWSQYTMMNAQNMVKISLGYTFSHGLFRNKQPKALSVGSDPIFM